MVRASQSTTFSSESYFDDRGVYGHAQPITEHVNVRKVELIHPQHHISHHFRFTAPFPTNRFILFS